MDILPCCVAMTPVEHFQLYQARVSELKSCRLLRSDGLNLSLSINFDQLSGLHFSSAEPDEDDLRSFLLAFRHFLSKDEPVFINRIYNLCEQHISGDALRMNLRNAREAWKEKLKGGGFTLTVDGRGLTPEYAMDLWINGHYFHSDPEKRRELARLAGGVEARLVRYRFLDLLVQALKQVLYLNNIITVALKEGLVV